MITHGNKQISEIVYARKASEGGGAVRLTNIIRGAQVVFGGLKPDVKTWLKYATKAAILAAFGQTDGKAVIKATNAYLNALAATDPTKASSLAGFINEDPMLVCSLGLQPQGVTMPIRWHRMVNGYWDTGLQVTMTNWNKIRYILDAVATTTNVGNRWFANGVGGGSICGLHVGLNNGRSNYTSAPFTYANGYNDVTLSNETKGSYGKRYRWDFDLLHETYKVYDDTGTLIVNVAATLKAPTANNTSGGITVGRWHKYNNINSGSTHSADTRECLQYVDDELVNWFVPFTRNGVFGMLNIMTNTFAAVSGTPEEKFGWWENGSFIEWTPLNQTP